VAGSKLVQTPATWCSTPIWAAGRPSWPPLSSAGEPSASTRATRPTPSAASDSPRRVTGSRPRSSSSRVPSQRRGRPSGPSPRRVPEVPSDSLSSASKFASVPGHPMGLRAVRHFKASLALLLLAGVAGAESAPRVLLGAEPVPELAVVRALESCRGAQVACFEQGWLDGFRLARDASAIGLDTRPEFLRVRRELLLDELYADLGRSLPPLGESELKAAYDKDLSE